MDELPEKTSGALLALGGVVLQFATIQRATLLADGVTVESDTDHTVMVGLIACALAAAQEPSYDLGKIAQFALVHDLVEVYAGDTNTFGMTNNASWKDKEARETRALLQIQKEFDQTLPWISQTIKDYESLESPEARFVKTLDKTMPKITRYFNNGAVLSDPEAFSAHCEQQLAMLRTSYGKDQKSVIAFYEYMVKKVFAILHAKKIS